MKRKLLLLTLLLALLLVNTAQAMTSTNYRLDWLVPLTDGGGGTADSANFTISYTVGQTAIGSSDSSRFSLRSGFWQEFEEQCLIWLSVIVR